MIYAAWVSRTLWMAQRDDDVYDKRNGAGFPEYRCIQVQQQQPLKPVQYPLGGARQALDRSGLARVKGSVLHVLHGTARGGTRSCRGGAAARHVMATMTATADAARALARTSATAAGTRADPLALPHPDRTA